VYISKKVQAQSFESSFSSGSSLNDLLLAGPPIQQTNFKILLCLRFFKLSLCREKTVTYSTSQLPSWLQDQCISYLTMNRNHFQLDRKLFIWISRRITTRGWGFNWGGERNSSSGKGAAVARALSNPIMVFEWVKFPRRGIWSRQTTAHKISRSNRYRQGIGTKLRRIFWPPLIYFLPNFVSYQFNDPLGLITPIFT